MWVVEESGVPGLIVTKCIDRLYAGPELLLCFLEKDFPCLLVMHDKIEGIEIHNMVRPGGSLCIRYGLITRAMVRREGRQHGDISSQRCAHLHCDNQDAEKDDRSV